MEREETKNLRVFGYGLALIIPFLALLQAVKEDLKFLPFALIFIGGLVSLMVLITRIAEHKPLKNAWIFVVQAGVLVFKIREGAGWAALAWLGVSAALLAVTVWQTERLRPLYAAWMRGAHAVGQLVSAAILGLLFFLVFTPVGLVLRLLRKDLLDERLEPEKESYWQKREYAFKEENYKRQF